MRDTIEHGDMANDYDNSEARSARLQSVAHAINAASPRDISTLLLADQQRRKRAEMLAAEILDEIGGAERESLILAMRDLAAFDRAEFVFRVRVAQNRRDSDRASAEYARELALATRALKRGFSSAYRRHSDAAERAAIERTRLHQQFMALHEAHPPRDPLPQARDREQAEERP